MNCDCKDIETYHCGCRHCPEHGWTDCRYWLPHVNQKSREAFCWAWEERIAEPREGG